MRSLPLLARLARLAFAVLLAVAPAGAARAETPAAGKRVALVIGIDAYQNAPHLKNPGSDARAIGEALRGLGFTVTTLLDPDLRSMEDGVRDFGVAAQSADAALIYYAGHGVQVNHENYLLPADVKLQRGERDLRYEALPLDVVLEELAGARKIGIIMLDSCRDNPFVERMSAAAKQAGRPLNIEAGMARVDNPQHNTFVAMATRADQVAEDGIDHSPFATEVLKDLQIPGLELGKFFRKVTDGVLAATNNRQEPFTFGSLGADDFYLHPRPPSHPPEIAAITPLDVRDNAGPTPLGLPRPTDRDGNPLTIRVVGLPRAGAVSIAGRPLMPNASIPLDSFMTATYQPDGRTLGPVGSFDFLVEDGEGNSVAGNLPITVVPSHHPAVVEAKRVVLVYPRALGIVPPTSPDGDPLTVEIISLPRGLVRNGETTVRIGDVLTPADLGKLTFMPDPNATGSAGSLIYSVDNGRGDTVEGRIELVVYGNADPETTPSAAAVWERLRKGGSAAELEAFLRLFPTSRFAADARARLATLTPAAPAQPEPAPATTEPAPVAAPVAVVPPAETPTATAPAMPVSLSPAPSGEAAPETTRTLAPPPPTPAPSLPASAAIAPPPRPVEPAKPAAPDPEEDVSREQWQRYQQSLATVGHDVGQADGVPGGQTRKALLQFQKEKGLPRTGTLDRKTRQKLDEAAQQAAQQERERQAALEAQRKAEAEAAAKAAKAAASAPPPVFPRAPWKQ